jgi:dTDP-glucose pyrophosphorylase
VVALYLYGPESHSVAEAVEPEWRAWLETTFPSQ